MCISVSVSVCVGVCASVCVRGCLCVCACVCGGDSTAVVDYIEDISFPLNGISNQYVAVEVIYSLNLVKY